MARHAEVFHTCSFPSRASRSRKAIFSTLIAHGNHLGSFYPHCPDHTLQQLNQNFWGWGPGLSTFKAPPGDYNVHSRSRTTALWPSFHRPCCLCNLPVSGWTNAHGELWGPVQSLLPSSGAGPAAPHPPPPTASSQDARAHFSPLHTSRQQMRPSMARKAIWTSSK